MTAADRDREADAYLAALLRYSEGFYGVAIERGMRAAYVADAMAHIERAARGLHRLVAEATHARAQAVEPVAGAAPKLLWTVGGNATLAAPGYAIVATDRDDEYGLRYGSTIISTHRSYEAAQKAAEEHWHQRCGTHPAPAQEPVAVPAGMTADEAWQDLCEKDDRTSIDYPGFALIRQDELAGYMAAAPVSPPAERTIEATQIAMGHGLVDVVDITHEGRRGILFHPRAEHLPIGGDGSILEGQHWPEPGDVVIWIDDPAGADVILHFLKPFLPVSPPAESGEELTADFAQSLPGGKLDDSTYSKIEDALDRIDAPMTGHDGRWLALHERIAALASTPAPHPGGTVKVKTLEWVNFDRYSSATSAVGGYEAYDDEWWFLGEREGPAPNRDAAKAAAQADYEQRIASALSPSPSGWDAGAAMRAEAAKLVRDAGGAFGSIVLAEKIMALSLPTPAGEG